MSTARSHVYEAPYIPANGQNLHDASQKILHNSRWGQFVAMAKQPTTTPRWLAFVTHGALIITILAGVISYGRSAGRTEAALKNYENVPKIESNVSSLTSQLNKIEELISKQNEKTNQTLDSQNKRIDDTQRQIAALTQQLNALNSSFGSVWALAQSDSNKMSKLEGMLTAMQNMQGQQQRKDK